MRAFTILFALFLAPVAAAAQADIAALEALRDGDMRKLNFHAAPRDASDASFADLDGGRYTLEDFRGQVVVVNFWATWCAPCREEMPALDALQAEFGGPDFQVVTLATGRNAPQAMRRFFEEEGVRNLPLYTDANQAVARDMAVLGLPITVILDREGGEIARLRGGADWSGESARAIVRTLIDRGA